MSKISSEVARLARFRALRAEASEGETVTASELATVLGMTWRGIKLVIDQNADFPVVQRGAEGHEWTLDLCAVLDWWIARDDLAVRAAEERNARLAKLAGIQVEVGEGSEAPSLTVEEIRALAAAVIQAQKLKAQQGELIVAQPARDFWASYHEHFQQEVIGLLGRIDPAGQIEAPVRELIEDDMRTLLVALQGRMEAFIEGLLGNHPIRP